MEKTKIDDFTLVKPYKGNNLSAGFNILLDGSIRLNTRLKEKLSKTGLEIRINENGEKLLLTEKDINEGNKKDLFKIQSSGTVRAKSVFDTLADKHVKLPAHYDVQWNGDLSSWYCTYISNFKFPKQKVSKKKIGKRKKTGLNEIVQDDNEGA